jgi:hypothetical protein
MLVFKTNVNSQLNASEVSEALKQSFSIPLDISFDLEDCDRILRISSTSPLEQLAIQVKDAINLIGFNVELLPDEALTIPDFRFQQRLTLKLLTCII